jgi:phosphate/phosphite/phosphonate ABC transporter binding protein
MTRFLILIWMLACTSAPLVESPVSEEKTDIDTLATQLRSELESRGLEGLSWAITPFRGSEGGSNPYTALVQSVSKRLDIPIELQVGKDYADLENQIVLGQVDLAVLGPYSYVRARKRADGIQVFASHISRGNITYGAYIISQANGPIQKLADLRGSRMAFVDKRSASGWLFPAARFLDEGIHPINDLQHHFYGNHESVVNAVVAGEADAGATYSDVLLDRQRDRQTELHIVAKGALIPHDAYVLRAGLPAIVGEAVGRAMSEISTRDDEGRSILAPLWPINGFLPVDDGHFEPVRIVDAQVEAALGSAP